MDYCVEFHIFPQQYHSNRGKHTSKSRSVNRKMLTCLSPRSTPFSLCRQLYREMCRYKVCCGEEYYSFPCTYITQYTYLCGHGGEEEWPVGPVWVVETLTACFPVYWARFTCFAGDNKHDVWVSGPKNCRLKTSRNGFDREKRNRCQSSSEDMNTFNWVRMCEKEL
jgi:hypothetical protein